jgi:hypothetical protein
MPLKIKLGSDISKVPHLKVQHISALLTITPVSFRLHIPGAVPQMR